ncbi:MAG: hypothetical protein HRT47_02470 [Candidatus Caenarcaniphilales bacterium]|nr:hypothetical protein [Candidatus Caenarcaniphilales bacterium]
MKDITLNQVNFQTNPENKNKSLPLIKQKISSLIEIDHNNNEINIPRTTRSESLETYIASGIISTLALAIEDNLSLENIDDNISQTITDSLDEKWLEEYGNKELKLNDKEIKELYIYAANQIKTKISKESNNTSTIIPQNLQAIAEPLTNPYLDKIKSQIQQIVQKNNDNFIFPETKRSDNIEKRLATEIIQTFLLDDSPTKESIDDILNNDIQDLLDEQYLDDSGNKVAKLNDKELFMLHEFAANVIKSKV